MGSSKKHSGDKDKEGHREHKRKRKHKDPSGKSRSRSPSHKKHKHEKKSKRKEREYMEELRAERQIVLGQYLDPYAKQVKDEDPEDGEIREPADSGPSGDGTSLSIEATNKLRAKLGLAPLSVGGSDGADGVKKEGEDVHVPATNMAALKKQEELREKMAQIREKRKINQKLGKVKTLGDSDSEEEEGALAWISKNRKLIKEREVAEKRAKLLDQMDEEFGIGDLVEEAFADKKSVYASEHLKGLTVKHDIDRFKDGHNVILTLEDKGILDDDGEEVLININLVDDEKADKNNERKLKKPEYNPYDDGDEEGGLFYADVLDKYDEKEAKSFTLGKGGTYKADYERQMKQFKKEAKQRAEGLNLPSLQIASEYYTQAEMDKFKKVKKKVRKIRKKPKMLTADDLEPIDKGFDYGQRSKGQARGRNGDEEIGGPGIPGLDLVKEEELPEPMEDDSERLQEACEDLTGVAVGDEEAMFELELAVKKARKLKQKREKGEKLVAERLKLIKKEEPDPDPVGAQNIVLNSTSEFCRTLGDIPTYGQSGNRNEDEDDLMDLDDEDEDENKDKMMEEEPATGWQSVEIDTRPVDIKDEEHAAIEEEPTIGSGTIGALQLAQKKGYLEQGTNKRISAPTHIHLQAKNYSIEDKRYDDLDDKYRKRDRYNMGGATQDFRELDYKPEVQLEYVDETGRVLSEKEAFRQLSHRFHGKGSGKKKTEKRFKKLEQDHLLKNASSSDTPLGTVALLQEKQKQDKAAFVILSGGNKGFNSTTISK